VAFTCPLLLIPLWFASPRGLHAFFPGKALLALPVAAISAFPLIVGAWRLRQLRKQRRPLDKLALALVALGLLSFPAGRLVVAHQTERYWAGRYEREALNRCVSHLRQLGLACLIYAAEPGNNGRFPDSLDLLDDTYMQPSDFVCPFTNIVPPQSLPNRHFPPGFRSTPGNVSYIYLGRGLTTGTVNANTILAYDRPSNHAARGLDLCVLYADGRAQFIPPADLQKLIASNPTTRP
jgi:hypothetical protein